MTGQTPARGGTERLIAVLAAVMCVVCILWNIEAPTRMGVAILTQQYMAFQLGLALTIAYLRFNRKGKETSRVGWIDGLIAVTSAFQNLDEAARAADPDAGKSG